MSCVYSFPHSPLLHAGPKGDSGSYGDSDHKMKKKKGKKRRTDAEEVSSPIPQPLDAGGNR